MAMFIVKPWYKERAEENHIYGVSWDGSSSQKLTRTNDSANFPDVNFYYSGMETRPSSPFDKLYPWKDIRVVEDPIAGSLVELPIYWYNLVNNSTSGLSLKIANYPASGFSVSPAHMDRGDGVGQRSYVYVGRYHSGSDGKSKSNVLPSVNSNRSAFANTIHSLGNNIWMQDANMFWTIRMLYLVETANWNSQNVIGLGNGSNQLIVNGSTDSLPYHSGTSGSSRSEDGHVQYRLISDVFSNVSEFVNCIDFYGTNWFQSNKPDNTGGDYITKRSFTTGYIRSWNVSPLSAYGYSLVPNNAQSSADSYIGDYSDGGGEYGEYQYLVTGGNYSERGGKKAGMFRYNMSVRPNYTSSYVGCRLMVLPPSRLSA